MSQRVLPRVVFDHCPLLVVAGSVNKGRIAFKFENVVERKGFCREGLAMVEWVLLCGFSKLYFGL